MLLRNIPEILETNKKSDNFSIYNILNEFENKKDIVVLAGQVQSGKTKWIIEIIKQAINQFNYDHIFFISGTNTPLFEQSNIRLSDEAIKFKTKLTNDVQVYSVLKETKWLNKMNNLISSLTYKSKKILIIDDEGDYASINASKDDGESTKIHELIINAYKEILGRGGIIYVTATPFANCSNLNSQFLPKCIYTLPINDDYTGLEFFNNLHNFYICYEENNYLNQIRFSFCFWLLKSYLFFKEYPNEKSDFLIYISEEKKDHEKYWRYVNQLINDLQFVKYNEESIITNLCYKINENYQLKIDMIDFFNFIKLNQTNIEEPLIFNSIGKDESFFKYKNSNKKMKIIIGGKFLSRGFTYDNLLTECFYYIAKNQWAADTILQRCRWFGYRKKNRYSEIDRYKYMNLITNSKIKKIFIEIEKYNQLITKNKNGMWINFPEMNQSIIEIEKNLNVKGTSYAKK